MLPITFLKIGGSIITDKSKPYTADRKIIEQISSVIATHTKPLVITHGSGSYGHTSAKKYGGKKGYLSRPGIATVAYDARSINQIVMTSLIKHDIPAVSLSPMSMIQTTKGIVTDSFFNPVETCLNQGLLPVLYGDVIWDTAWKSTIYSGEKTLNILAQYLEKKGYSIGTIIQLTDTNGVYDLNGETIPEISINNWKKIQTFFQKSTNADVTGGMEHKVAEALTLAENGFETWIINGRDKHAISSALQRKLTKGTKIR